MQSIAVIGALGKMGRGIAALLLEHYAFEGEDFELHLIDVNQSVKPEVRQYLVDLLKRAAEKRIVDLRIKYADREDLISNGEIIEAFLLENIGRISFHRSIKEAEGATKIFEAALEEVDFKVDLFKQVNPKATIFTNTSSIPIHVLNEKASLNGRIIGFHFYNPPPMQPLMEIIALEDNALKKEAEALAAKLKKTVVSSNDHAGFIGNGHFLREVALAFELLKDNDMATIDRVTKKELVRPMGIFELIKFVGFPVVYNISKIMNQYGSFKPELKELKKWIDTSYKLELPETKGDWKEWSKRKDKQELIEKHFEKLSSDSSKEAKLAFHFLDKSAQFMEELVEEKTAKSLKDVSQVLKLGFHHLYSPDEVAHAIR